MRTASRPAVGAVIGVAALVLVMVAPANGVEPVRKTSPAAKIAREICEPMVRSAIEAATGAPLPTPQVGAWRGKRYSCTYDVGDGSIVLRVDIKHDVTRAKTAFAQERGLSSKPEKLAGLGQQAFQTRQGLLVARKGRFLLRIEPNALPARVNHVNVAYAAAVAVLICWTGE